MDHSCTKRPSECTIHFFLVRHGETDWNASQRIQGHRDVPLNDRGLAQAEAVGRYFVGRHINALYCSDLVRAQQTARPIAGALNLQAMHNADLRERNYGRCEGLTREQLVTDYLEDAHALKARDPDYVLPGGESLNQHRQRIFTCLEQLIACHAGQTVVVVTHGGVLDLIYRHTTGMALDKPRNFPIPNAGINLLTVNNGQWSIQLWAETTHLGE